MNTAVAVDQLPEVTEAIPASESAPTLPSADSSEPAWAPGSRGWMAVFSFIGYIRVGFWFLLTLAFGLCAEGQGMPAKTNPGITTLTVTIRDEAPYFLPKRATVAAGATVTWKNTGPNLIHTIAIRRSNGVVTSGSVLPGHSWTYHFAESEDAVVRTSCEIHPYMYGMLIVGNPPSELISAIESGSTGKPGSTGKFKEFPLPVPSSVPGVVAIDSDDSVWFTMGGGGFANLANPPLSHVGRMTSDGDLTVYTLPQEHAGPSGISLGSHGTAYVTEFFGNSIAKIDSNTKTVREFTIPTPDSWPTGIGQDSKGAVWFNETKGNKVGKLTPDGVILEYPVPTPNARATGLVVDKDDRVWIAERDTNKIGCLRQDGTFVEYAIPTADSKPTGIAVDADNSIWFSEREGNKIGLLRDGSIREFDLPQARSGPFIIALDREGTVWFSEIFGNRIGHLDPKSAHVEEFAIPSPDSWPAGIAFDSLSNIWFASQLKNRIGLLVLNSDSGSESQNNKPTAAHASPGAHHF